MMMVASLFGWDMYVLATAFAVAATSSGSGPDALISIRWESLICEAETETDGGTEFVLMNPSKAAN